MNELKSEIIINAGIRAAERNFSSAYIIKRGDSDAGAIFGDHGRALVISGLNADASSNTRLVLLRGSVNR